MEQYTQSNLNPGNCWQTAIACVLNIPPDELPPQVEIEAWPHEILNGWGSYHNAINGYLTRHHALIYSLVQEYQFGSVTPTNPDHIICGPSERTEKNKLAGLQHVNHCVVGFEGKEVWDPHPSRAGLTEHNEWGIFGPISSRMADTRNKRGNAGYRLVFECLCPACGLTKARERATAVEDANADNSQ